MQVTLLATQTTERHPREVREREALYFKQRIQIFTRLPHFTHYDLALKELYSLAHLYPLVTFYHFLLLLVFLYN